MLAFPDRLRAPPADESSTMIDWPIVMEPVLALLAVKLVSPE